jgi:2-polyprenyl-6-hydroxyphenyl methylase/3-demethylubiquinone-9 3-methyltransferase
VEIDLDAPDPDRRPGAKPVHQVDNTIYRRLGDRWYDAEDDPVALLRAEARHKNPWIAARLADAFGGRACRVLDVGCGAGFLANDLAVRGNDVVGLDAAPDALDVARAHADPCSPPCYVEGDALSLPWPDGEFDAVCAMDFLEHVEEPQRVIAEAARVLTPGGRFFFHTFNRTWLAWLIVIQGVRWFVRNTPRDLHLLRLFVKPSELDAMCRAAGLELVELRGSRPRFDRALARLVATGRVRDVSFTFTRSLALGYAGVARRLGPARPTIVRRW